MSEDNVPQHNAPKQNEVPKAFADISPEVYENFRTAIEIRKWPNGTPLTPQQLETCMQAVIAYERKHLSEDQHTGYVPPKTEPCDHEHPHDREQPIKWQK